MRRRTGLHLFRWALSLAAALVLAGPRAQPALAAEPIRIGFSLSLSGSLAGAGKPALLAMQIWTEDINAKGGVLGRPVKLVYYDDHSKPADVPPIYTKLITVDKVDFVMSPYGTPLQAPAMPVVMEHKKVFVAHFATALNEAFKYRYYFTIIPSGPDPYVDLYTGFFATASRQKPKPKTLALLAVDNEHGANSLLGAKKHAKKFGFQIIYEKRYPPGTADFTPILRAIKAQNPDLLFVASYPPDSVGVVKAAKEIDLKPKLFGGGMVGLQYTAVQMNLGPMLNGIVNYWFWAPEPTLKFPGIEEFLKKYQARAAKEGLDPLGFYLPPFAYAAIQLLGQAIEATKSLDQTTVGEYIRTREFNTIVGKVKFAPNGEWARSRSLLVQLQNIKSRNVTELSKPGKMVVIYPEEYKSGNLVYPFPGWD